MEKRWIWPFELLEKIGEGGMGEVYRARYVKNDRIVAVKLLPASITDETLLARFEREMQILKGLRHPHIVHTFGGKCEGDQRFYAMELIEGGTLDQVLVQKGRLSVDSTIAYGLEMCSALAYAHSEKIIHRDIKPGNFLLTKTGELKLSDFGLATFASASKLTAAGKTMGTFRYMAPEQIRGKPDPCAQTDIYSLGIVFFEMLTGQPPFMADAAGEVLRMHLKTPPPRVSALMPTVPAAIDELIYGMMQKSIEARPASAIEVGLALKNASGVVEVAHRRTMTAAAPATEAERAAAQMSDDSMIVRVERGIPAWTLAIPSVIALLAIFWAWSQRGDVKAFQRIEATAIQWFQNGTSAERDVAARILGQVGLQSDEGSELLLNALDQSDPSVRAAAATALGNFGADGKFATGRLRKLAQQDDRPEVRAAAVEAITKITGEAPH